MRKALVIVIAPALQACAIVPHAPPIEQTKALFIGEVKSSEFIATLSEVMPDQSDGKSDTIWHGEIYEVKLKVLDRLSGGPVGSTVTVKLTAHARKFEGMTLAVMTDPNLAFYGVNLGTSWWENLSPEDTMLCVPDDLLQDAAFATFVSRSKAVDDSRCIEIK